MNKFRFNTGVNIKDNPHIGGGIDSGNGIVVIPFEADAPKDAELVFLSDHITDNGLLRCEAFGKVNSKYAYFKV